MTDIAEATLVMSTVVKNVSGMNLLSHEKLPVNYLFRFPFLYSRMNHRFNGTEGNSKNFVAHKELVKISVALREFAQY